MIRNERVFRETAPSGFDGKFDWDFLLPAFEGTKIEPMDIDCCIERYGEFLILETKSPGKLVPKGQVITLESLVRTRRAKVIIIHAKIPVEIHGWCLWHWSKGCVQKDAYKGGSDALVCFVGEWFMWASEVDARLDPKRNAMWPR